MGGAVIERQDQLLLVCNRRRDGRIDWTTPGGVIDAGESVLAGLTREVREETGIEVSSWSQPLYEVDVIFQDMGSHLRVVAHSAVEWIGELAIEDPDGIVVDADFVGPDRRNDRLTQSPQWVREPLLDWMSTRISDTAGLEATVSEVRVYEYLVTGTDLARLTVEPR